MLFRARLGRFVAPLGLALATAAGCGGGGGGGGAGGSVARGGSAGGIPAATTTNQPQWQTAMAALAAQQAGPDPLYLEGPSLQAFNDLLRRNWPHLVPFITSAFDHALQGQVGQSLAGGIRILSIRGLVFDGAAAPALHASQPATTAQTAEIALPDRPNRWSLRFTAEVGGTVTLDIFGLRTSIPIHVDVDVAVREVSILQGVLLDQSRPDDVRIVGAQAPQIAFRLELASSTPIVSTVLGAITTALDPVVRIALALGAATIQQEVGLALQSVVPQGPAWGLGGPAPGAVAGAAPLEPLARDVADRIQQHHMPFDHVIPAVFDTPHQGGSVDHYVDHGDSAIWTGHYLASECYRFDLTGSPLALQYAERTVRGLRLLLDVAGQGGGLLSRAAAPVTSPHSQPFYGSRTHFVGVVNGVQYVALEHISRDQYTGFMLGMGQAWYRVPALRADAAELIGRVVGYLESTDWIARRADHINVSTTFVQSPGTLLAFSKLGALVDPARFDAPYQANKPLASFLWFPDWFSSREVHESYYKFNLGHANLLTMIEVETDPTQYRGYLQKFRILRSAIGHHNNAWFDAIYAVAAPPEQATLGPKVKDELDHWALRPQRGFTVQNSTDPSIASALYTVTMPNSSGGFGFPQLQTAPRSKLVAVHPVPIEKQPPTDFLWQRSPFGLDGGTPPEHQFPGIDLVAPYWLARNHGFVQ